MRYSNILVPIILINLFLTACDKDEDDNFDSCRNKVTISSEEYDTAPNHPLTIHEIELIDDCIKFDFSSNGCDGDSWTVKLIASELDLLSNPPQRNLRLSLKNEEPCEALIRKQDFFDLSELQVDGNQILLRIKNWDEPILYEYQ